jgi:threonine synthase
MMGVQAEGAAPIARAFKEGKDAIKPIADPDTLATAIRIGSPVSWRKALWAVKKSGGLMEMVSDEEILEAQAFLARGEGIFVEPASAASIAGLLKISAAGSLDRTEKVVCVTTGHGLKDQDIILRRSPPVTEVDPSADSVAKALGLM